MSYDEATQAVFQTACVEVHDQTHADTAHAEVGLNLRFMCWQDRRNGFDFQDDHIRHHDVGSETVIQMQAFVDDRNGDLALGCDSGLRKLVTRTSFVD